MKKVLLISIFFISAITYTTGQENNIFKAHEDTLAKIAFKILNGANDSLKEVNNFQFKNSLTQILETKGSFDWPFDSLVTIAILSPPDGRFRIFNWNLPKEDGTFLYFGILQTHDTLFHLLDHSENIKSPTTSILSHNNWYGCHYYKIIQNKYKSKTYYTLLGWDGNNNFSTKKIIDILAIDDPGTPTFGAPIFNNYSEDLQTRVIFEYSSRVSMSLKYEEQSYKKIIRKKKSSKLIEVSTEMIVFDRLAPLDISLTGQYKYYAPFEGIFDGFIFEDGYWFYLEEINAWNRDLEDPSGDRKTIEYDLVPPR